jgi:hypothetical protein
MTTLMTEAARERAFRDAVFTSLRGWPPEAAGRSRDCEPVDPDSPELVYAQLVQLISARIDSGEWPAGTRLPSEPDLSEAYGVSRDSIRKAARQLAAEGRLMIVRGKGTFVSRPGGPAQLTGPG